MPDLRYEKASVDFVVTVFQEVLDLNYGLIVAQALNFEQSLLYWHVVVAAVAYLLNILSDDVAIREDFATILRSLRYY